MVSLCELFGIIGNKKTLLNENLKQFYSHGSKHPHGWGLAYLENDGSQTIYKEPVCASDSNLLKKILKSKIESRFAIGHIRFATIGNISQINCHPFSINDITGRQWTLAHNGNIYAGLKLLEYTKTQIGQTDSERVLLRIIDKINIKTKEKGTELTAIERCEVVDKTVSALSFRNKLNLLIYDSELFYVHTNIKDTLYGSFNKDFNCFATVPINDKYKWEPIPLNSLLAFSGTKKIYHGKNHGNEFIKGTPSSFDNFSI